MNLPVTYLFVPGNRPDRFGKALASSAGVIIVDLEDAVAPGDKDAARTAFADWYRASASARERIAVRINAEDTPWFADDLRVMAETGVRSVVLPKAENAAQIARAASTLPPDGFVIALVETAKGVIGVDELATAPRLQRIAFGTLDYALDLDLTGDERGLIYPACRIALASRAAGIAPPIAGVTPDIADGTRLRADLDFARACGFSAKLCIHPKQVEAVHAAMRPSDAEIAWAERVVAAAEGGAGAVQLDGKMVDRPVLVRAERILNRT
ncbi:MAG TPA: CoA ester lyase [Blastocatellia bacterium]|nr:CoA ester lyase [Blastocatellia bacterium]